MCWKLSDTHSEEFTSVSEAVCYHILRRSSARAEERGRCSVYCCTVHCMNPWSRETAGVLLYYYCLGWKHELTNCYYFFFNRCCSHCFFFLLCVCVCVLMLLFVRLIFPFSLLSSSPFIYENFLVRAIREKKKRFFVLSSFCLLRWLEPVKYRQVQHMTGYTFMFSTHRWGTTVWTPSSTRREAT